MIRLKGYSTWWRDVRVRRYAKKHVGQGVPPSPDLVTVKLIGPRPELTSNPEYARLSDAAIPDPRRETWKAEREGKEKALAQSVRPWVLLFGIAALWIVEFFAARELLHNEGFLSPTLEIVSAATACMLGYLMFQAAKETV